MNGVVLVDTAHSIFDFYGEMVDDVAKYCNSVGYQPDKIVFVSSYDIEVQKGMKLRMEMGADSKVSIIEEDGQVIARVCIGESVTIKKEHGYK